VLAAGGTPLESTARPAGAGALTLLVVLYSCAAAGLFSVCVRECERNVSGVDLADEILSKNVAVIGCLACRARRSFGNLTAERRVPRNDACGDGKLSEIGAHAGTGRVRAADIRIW